MDHTECEASPDTVVPEYARSTDSAGPIPVQIDPELLENEGDGKLKHTELTKAQLKIRRQEKKTTQQKVEKVSTATPDISMAVFRQLNMRIEQLRSKGPEAPRAPKAKLLRLRQIRTKKCCSEIRKT